MTSHPFESEYEMVISERVEVALNRAETAPEALQEPGSPGRGNRGRWLRGCSPGPGRPPAAQEQAYRDALRAVASPEDLNSVFAKVVAKAKAGDLGAAKVAIERLAGPPGSEPPEVTEEFDLWAECKTIEPLITALVREIPLPRLAELIRAHAGLSSRDPGPGGPSLRVVLLATVIEAVPKSEQMEFVQALRAPYSAGSGSGG